MKHKRGRSDEDSDPLTGVANLFDVAMIFAVGLLVMMMRERKRLYSLMSSYNKMLRK